MRIVGNTLHFAVGWILELKSEGNPLEKTREKFIDDEMAARNWRVQWRRDRLSSAYSDMIREMVGEGKLSIEDAAKVGEGFLAEIGMDDRIRSLCQGNNPWEMSFEEFKTKACFVSTHNNEHERRIVYFAARNKFCQDEKVEGTDEGTIERIYKRLKVEAMSAGYPVHEVPMSEMRTLSSE
jgi:hypothetical protein